jgi:hypothetical protein
MTTKFRVLVTEETVYTDELCIATKKMYCAVALEWYIAAQGESVQEAVDSCERLLVQQAWMLAQDWHKRFSLPEPAPEDYQRCRNSGDTFICTDSQWSQVIRPCPIVHRADIDLETSKWRIVEKST